MDKPHSTPSKFRKQDTKKGYTKELFRILHIEPKSRRMAATELGFIDQTYMVTPFILKWIREDKAAVVGVIKCSRSGRLVEAISTNPSLFPKSNQYTMFE